MCRRQGCEEAIARVWHSGMHRGFSSMIHQPRTNKAVTLSLLWSAQMVTYMIRIALGIVAPILMTAYHITPKSMGYILSGWNWSYTGALPIIGPIVDRFGPWIVMSIGSVLWGLSTIALPVAVAAAPLFLMRLVFGLGHSPMIPANAGAVSRVFEVKERTRAVAFTFSGNQVGLALGATIASYILHKLGWQSVFYCIGGVSLLWTLAWVFFFPDKRIGTRLAQAHGQGQANETSPTWASLLQKRSTWGIALGQCGYLYVNYFLSSWLPGYLVLERKMTILKTGVAAALPFWGGMLGTLGGGWLGDFLIQRGVTTTVSRKVIIGVAMTLSMVTLISAAYAANVWMAVTLLTLCSTFLRMATGSVNSLPIDLAPRSRVSSLTSIQSFFGNVGGLLAPIVTGYIVDATGSFVFALVTAGAMSLFGAMCYVFLVGNVENRQLPEPPCLPGSHLRKRFNHRVR
ncbi:MAG: MFS transporter [Acidobacteria bacterium]|nr:MFS transporter [Acidobacteriota bacterium]